MNKDDAVSNINDTYEQNNRKYDLKIQFNNKPNNNNYFLYNF